MLQWHRYERHSSSQCPEIFNSLNVAVAILVYLFSALVTGQGTDIALYGQIAEISMAYRPERQ